MALSTRQLAYTAVTETPSPEKWLYVVHGIFGAGRNWSSVIRRVVRNRPEWGALLIDLREHGGSQDFDGPHTIEAAANDITELARHTGTPPTAILGHSFGGKVSMMFARSQTPGSSLRQAWIVDSTPATSTPGGAAYGMMEVVKTIPSEFATREEAIAAMVAHDVLPPTAAWMATNLVQKDGAYRWRFRQESMEELLQDFFRTDLWDVVESPPAGIEMHLIKATSSSLLSGSALDRLKNAADNVHMYFHEVEGGHWLNADNPDAIVELLTENLS